MKFIFLPLVLCMFGLATDTIAQNAGYSESKIYRPREQPKEKKKKKESKEIAAATPNPSVSVDNAERIVSLPVSVFDEKGRFHRGLTSSDFSLFVDDKEIPIAKFGERPEPLTVVLLLDASPSAFIETDALKNLAKGVLSELGPDVNVAVVEFNSSMRILCDVTKDHDKARQAIDKVRIGDGTSLYKSVEVLFREIDPKLPGRKIAVLLTDGVDTTSRSSSYAESLLDAEKGLMSVYPIYLDTESAFAKSTRGHVRLPPGTILPGMMVAGRPLRSQKEEYERGRLYLGDIAGLSGARYIVADKLNSLETGLGEELKSQYFISFSLPSSVGRRSIRVRVNKPNLNVQTRGSIW